MPPQPNQIAAQLPSGAHANTTNSRVTIIVTLSAIVILFGLFTTALWRAGFFNYTGTDPSSKVVAATLALVGAFVGALVSIIGVLLKYSIDQQAESRLQIESQRAAALQAEAEQRLKLEAAIRAVELLGSGSGETTPIQFAGALFALASLDQHELTLSLASELLKVRKLEASAAVSLIDKALKRGDDAIQIEAIQIFYENADRMVTLSSVEIPSSIENWSNDLSAYSQEWAALALAKMLVSVPLSVWRTRFEDEANGIVAALALGWYRQHDRRIRNNIGATLKLLLSAFQLSGALYHPVQIIDVDALQPEILQVEPEGNRSTEMSRELMEWMKEDQPKTETGTS